MQLVNLIHPELVTVLIVFTTFVSRIDGQSIVTNQVNDWEIIARNSINFDASNETEVETETSRPFAEVPKSTMDIITVVWYLSTFLALAAFFFLMVCSDRGCGRGREEPPPPQQAPPTPAPSYSEFAPPSYETVVKLYPSVFVVPIHQKKPDKLNYNINFHTVNELQKIS